MTEAVFEFPRIRRLLQISIYSEDQDGTVSSHAINLNPTGLFLGDDDALFLVVKRKKGKKKRFGKKQQVEVVVDGRVKGFLESFETG
uniref:Uncharacterized protein n=1 Tax=viral metagenome TaxID=1070528 RepID=A0A6M3X6B8_9ZZZZ